MESIAFWFINYVRNFHLNLTYPTAGSQSKTLPWAIGSTTGKKSEGSSVAPYSATRETNGANDRNYLEKMQSISVMPIYSDKSHEELRMEDYELRNKGKTFRLCISHLLFIAFR